MSLVLSSDDRLEWGTAVPWGSSLLAKSLLMFVFMNLLPRRRGPARVTSGCGDASPSTGKSDNPSPDRPCGISRGFLAQPVNFPFSTPSNGVLIWTGYAPYMKGVPGMSDTLATPANTALAIASPWTVVPSLGNLDAYISAVNRLPIFTLEEERDFARRYRKDEDLEAAGKLVLSHLRLVVSVSRKYLGYGLPHADLIQEGNIGLMKAVKRFDPEQGVRLVSYALHWIRAEIHEYILRNWRMVKVATTKAQRKLFFNLRSMKQGFKDDEGAETHRDTLTEAQIEVMARELNVKREEVIEMEARMSGGDVVLDPAPADDGEDAYGPIAYLSDGSQEPTAVIESQLCVAL